MSRTRAERLQLMLAHRAAASALEASLKDEAAEEAEREGAKINWSWPGQGQVYTSHNDDASTVTDPAALLTWVKSNYPEQVQVIEAIRPAWLKVFLDTVEPIPDGDETPEPERVAAGDRLNVVDPRGGAIVPGVRWVKGGGLRSVSVKPDPDATRRMNLAAAAYAAGTGPLPGIEGAKA